MPDFIQSGLITTLHALTRQNDDDLAVMLRGAVRETPIGLVLPVTASDMREEPFDRILNALKNVDYLAEIVVTLGVAPQESDCRETMRKVAVLGERAKVLWTDGERVQSLYRELIDAGLSVETPGKGRSVWTAFGYLLADRRIAAFALHDCDIVNYETSMLARLCLPMVHPGLDFEFCKAYYARCTDRMYGRVVRLLVAPLLQALVSMYGHDRFLLFMQSFRYPLAGEFAVTSSLARSNRIPSDWGLEVGTLAEVFRNTSLKRVCQVELCQTYEHKHQDLSAKDPSRGLMKMAHDILITIFRTLASMGVALPAEHFASLRAAYLRTAQDMIRQYDADAIVNSLLFDRHAEEEAIESFGEQITAAGQSLQADPVGGQFIPNWTRVLTAFPNFPQRLREAVRQDAEAIQ